MGGFKQMVSRLVCLKGLFKSFCMAFAFFCGSSTWANGIPGVGGGGIPVECLGCEDATYSSAQMVADSLLVQTQTLVSAMDAALKMGATHAINNERRNDRMANQKAFNPMLGAKPRPSCGSYESSAVRGAAEKTAAGNAKAMMRVTKNHNEMAKGLAVRESRNEYFADQVLKVMGDPEYAGAQNLITRKTIDSTKPEEIQKAARDVNFITNPFPVNFPTAAEVERIREGKGGVSEADKAALAALIVRSQRQLLGQTAIRDIQARDITVLEIKKLPQVQALMKEALNGADAETAQQLQAADGRISPAALDRLMATYRVYSPEWITSVMTANSEFNAAREQVLMQAEMLNQLWRVNRNLETLVILTGMGDIKDF